MRRPQNHVLLSFAQTMSAIKTGQDERIVSQHLNFISLVELLKIIFDAPGLSLWALAKSSRMMCNRQGIRIYVDGLCELNFVRAESRPHYGGVVQEKTALFITPRGIQFLTLCDLI